MRSKTVLALVLLNLILVASLCSHTLFSKTADAQREVGRPSEYLQCSGSLQGLPAGVVFTIDTRNSLLGCAFTFDGTKLDGMQPFDLTRVFKKMS